jgi:hypothetical protein
VSGLQIVNAGIFWFRIDQTYWRCAALVAMDIPIIAVSYGLRRHSVNLATFPTRSEGVDPGLPNIAIIIFYVAIVDLGVHVFATAVWLWFLPLRLRLPNRYRPTLSQRSIYPQPQNSTLDALLPMERIFHIHELRRKRYRREPGTQSETARLIDHAPVPSEVTLSTVSIPKLHPSLSFWSFSSKTSKHMQYMIRCYCILCIIVGMLETVALGLHLFYKRPYPWQSISAYAYIWGAALFSGATVLLPSFPRAVNNKYWKTTSNRKAIFSFLIVYCSFGAIFTIYRCIWLVINGRYLGWNDMEVVGNIQTSFQSCSSSIVAFCSLWLCRELLKTGAVI